MQLPGESPLKSTEVVSKDGSAGAKSPNQRANVIQGGSIPLIREESIIFRYFGTSFELASTLASRSSDEINLVDSVPHKAYCLFRGLIPIETGCGKLLFDC
jgi:hypothetical protein